MIEIPQHAPTIAIRTQTELAHGKITSTDAFAKLSDWCLGAPPSEFRLEPPPREPDYTGDEETDRRIRQSHAENVERIKRKNNNNLLTIWKHVVFWETKNDGERWSNWLAVILNHYGQRGIDRIKMWEAMHKAKRCDVTPDGNHPWECSACEVERMVKTNKTEHKEEVRVPEPAEEEPF